MIFGLPCPGDLLHNFALVAKPDFALGQLGQERTPAPLSNEFVDVGDHLDRKDDVGSFR